MTEPSPLTTAKAELCLYSWYVLPGLAWIVGVFDVNPPSWCFQASCWLVSMGNSGESASAFVWLELESFQKLLPSCSLPSGRSLVHTDAPVSSSKTLVKAWSAPVQQLQRAMVSTCQVLSCSCCAIRLCLLIPDPPSSSTPGWP